MSRAAHVQRCALDSVATTQQHDGLLRLNCARPTASAACSRANRKRTHVAITTLIVAYFRPRCAATYSHRTLMLAKSPTSIVTTVSLSLYWACSACSSGELLMLRTVATTFAPAASS